MKKILTYILILSSFSFLKAQGLAVWDKADTIASSDDNIHDAIQVADSGYVLAGSIKLPSAPYTDNLLIRTDKNGDTLWTRNWGTTAYDGLMTIAERPGGGFVVAGDGNAKSFVFLDTLGNIESVHNYGGAFTLMDVAVLPDSGFIFTGINGAYPYACDLMMLRADKNGDTLWTRTFGGPRADLGRSVIYTSDGNYVVTGQSNYEMYWDGSYIPQRAYTLKIDPSGTLIWSDTIPGTVFFRSDAMEVVENKLGEYVIAGAASGSNALIANYSSTGTMNWAREYVNPYTSMGYTSYMFYSIEDKCDGGYIAVGYQTRPSAPSHYGALVMSTNSAGDSIFTNVTPPGYGASILRQIIPTLDSGYFGAGYSSGPTSYSQNSYLHKMDGQGGSSGYGVIGASFSAASSGLSVSFTDLSYGATNWYWDFGDGITSTSQNPVHVYSSAGGYTVCLTTWNYCDTATHCNFISINAETTSVEESNLVNCSIHPNPSSGVFTIDLNRNLNGTINVYSSLGALILTQKIDSGADQQQLDFGLRPKGVYLIEIKTDKQVVHKKIIRN